MSSSTFLLNDSKRSLSMQCKVAPVVVMAILNHHQRRPSNRKPKSGTNQPQSLFPPFVIGVLFGRKQPGTNTLIINDAFGMEAQVDPETLNVAVNVDNAKKALHLHAQTHPNDRFVGWYRTGLAIEQNSTTIHDMIILKKLAKIANGVSRKAGFSMDPSEFVHLLVDTALKNDCLSVKAYTMEQINDPLQEMEYNAFLKEKQRRETLKKQREKEKKKKTKGKGDKATESKEAEVLEPLANVDAPLPIFSRFVEITVEYIASESEMIGLDMIIESPPEGQQLDSPAILMNDTNHLEVVLQSLLQNIDDIEKYVTMVVNGECPADESLGWLIGDALSSVPNLSPQKFEHMVSNRLQDFLMMVYLGKMTKAQLVIADKINKILPNTVPGAENV